MSVPAYPDYKDSGVAWLGDVPSHWDVVPIKAIATSNDEVLGEATDPLLEIDYVEISDVAEIEGIQGSTTVAFGEAPSRARRVVRAGDILVSTVRTYLRAIAQVPSSFDGAIASTGFCVIRAVKADGRYLGYAVRAEAFISMVIARSVGVSYPAINASDLIAIRVPQPPLPEQTAIAAFLDRETAKIDALVAEQQRLIVLLKEKRQAVISHAVTKGLNPNAPMKDSGIEWLGDIPAHWEVVRIKNLADTISKGTTPTTIGADFASHGVRFLKAENISAGQVAHEPEFFVDVDTHAALSRSALQPNDVLVVIAGATTGKSAILPRELSPANTNQAVSFIRCTDADHAKLIHNWLGTTLVQNEILSTSVQSAQPNLSMEALGNLPMPVPPKTEYDQIISHLEERLSAFGTLMVEAQSAITLLQERRAALISAAVTGKIDLRGLAVAPAEMEAA